MKSLTWESWDSLNSPQSQGCHGNPSARQSTGHVAAAHCHPSQPHSAGELSLTGICCTPHSDHVRNPEPEGRNGNETSQPIPSVPLLPGTRHVREQGSILRNAYGVFVLSTSSAHGASISVSSWNGKAPASACSCMFVHEAANIYADELKLIRAKAS